MSVDVTNSPYALPPAGSPEDGLGYSRHYAQRIRDMGKSSKESWIKRLWNHMFLKKEKPIKESQSSESLTKDMGNENSVPTSRGPGTLPPINKEGSLVNIQQTNPKEHHVQFITPNNSSRNPKSQDGKRHSSNSAPVSGSNGKGKQRDKTKILPIELANSPYIAPKDRPNYKVEKGRSSTQTAHTGKDNGGRARGVPRDKEQLYMRKPVHPYLSQHQEVWRPRITRAPNMINLEKRAKSVAEKAMKEAKIFTCIAPYPVDAYIRYSLRKRGWVEKFGPKANASSSNNIGTKLECADEEDFEAICGQEVPAPWEEDHGVYAMMSRCCRHYPPKFIWGGRNVNSLILKSDVMVNHFPKARHFSSKVLLCQSLRELSWQNDSDQNDFFPRCYILGEEDKGDIIDDFRTTACIALLKWVLRMYMKGKSKVQEDHERTLQRENTKYEEVTSSKDCEKGTTNAGSIFDDIVTPEPSHQESQSYYSSRTGESDDAEDRVQAEDNSESRRLSVARSDPDLQPDRESSAVGNSAPDDPDSTNQELSEDYESLICTDDVDADDQQAEPLPISGRIPASAKNRATEEKVKSHFGLRKQSFLLPQVTDKNGNLVQPPEADNQNQVLPNLQPGHQKKGGEVPAKAVDWSIMHITRYLKSKNNEDLDLKYDDEGKNPQGPEHSLFRRQGLSQTQWKQLLDWYYNIAHHGAKVPMTESKLKEIEDLLRRVRRVWPQYDIDGKRNIWIVKPGDKSKAIGIEFTDKLDDILKFVSNTTIQGTYVIQKYIERPLLVYQCKFDIRQWFLVTDWNPLTLWFYKESYLRICSQEYQYDSMHESVHLSNVAVQQNYMNGERSNKLPDNNYMTSSAFKEYLSDIGSGNMWAEVIYPGMKKAISDTLIATQDINETRKNAFELYGADFMISENYQPWLIEINASPGMAPSSIEKVRLCSTVIEDTMRVVVDKKENKSSATGGFELVLRDAPIPQSKCVETKFVLEGQRIRRPDLQRYTLLDQKNSKAEEAKERKEQAKAEKLLEKQQQEKESEEEVKKEGEVTEQPVEEAKGEEQDVKQEVDEKEEEKCKEDKENVPEVSDMTNQNKNKEEKTDNKKDGVKKADTKKEDKKEDNAKNNSKVTKKETTNSKNKGKPENKRENAKKK